MSEYQPPLVGRQTETLVEEMNWETMIVIIIPIMKEGEKNKNQSEPLIQGENPPRRERLKVPLMSRMPSSRAQR